MSAPLAAFYAANALGEDDFAAMEAIAAMEEMGRRGHGARRLFHRAHQGHQQNRLAHCARFLSQHGFQVMPGGGGGGGRFGEEDDDMNGDADDPILEQELAADEEEVSALAGEDDEFGGDSKEELGADIGKMDHKLAKLHQKKHKWEMRLAATPEHRWRKRNRILKHIQKIDRAIMKVEGRKERKVNKIAAKMGVPPAVVAAALVGGGAAAGMGITAQQRNQVVNTAQMLESAAGSAAYGLNGRVERVQATRVETRLPFNDATTGSPVVAIQVAAGAGVRTAAINMVTASFPYAKFTVRGLDIDLNLQQSTVAGVGLAEALVNMLISQLVVNGGINLFYGLQSIKFVGQSVDNHASARRTLTGLRKNPTLNRTNTAVLAATFRQEVTTSAVLNATFQASLVCDVEEDDEINGRG